MIPAAQGFPEVGLRRNLSLYGIILPSFVLLAVFALVPFGWAFWTSLFDYEVGGDSRFVGLANYTEYLSDPTFLPSFLNMALLTMFGVATVLVFPLLVARLIYGLSSERAKYIYRLLFLVPIVVPGIASTLMWRGIVYADHGFINETLRAIGLGGLARGWLSDPSSALAAVAFIGFPFAAGINVLIYYAGLTAIPESVNDAAELDGSRGIGKFFRIEVPLLMSQVKLLVILTVIGSVQGFEGMLALTKGGPGFKTMLPGLWMYYNAFSFQRMGYACAIGVVLFALIFVLTLLNMKYVRSAEEITEARA
ncbi:carbohydrate ABC transporter permease [Fimbriimonas ginsengisoli]|uniref:Binding-protein-dependent transport system inner membrane component n=1 Tax=Fimbriimonas ginsengisoli Gsoil 348 TaxID=661478 RepID=A0A068NQ87_FIMGI|nr:sugar ABC transporter permease [Fimbriimonas ginsengisoli]AIE84925.1 Binding-protein-dependent transport system inner membrane component [Fimbriimonas ginsengisoli Gsoil 348]